MYYKTSYCEIFQWYLNVPHLLYSTQQRNVSFSADFALTNCLLAFHKFPSFGLEMNRKNFNRKKDALSSIFVQITRISCWIRAKLVRDGDLQLSSNMASETMVPSLTGNSSGFMTFATPRLPQLGEKFTWASTANVNTVKMTPTRTIAGAFICSRKILLIKAKFAALLNF